MPDSVAVRVPASSANLGPGFDSFAAALALYLDLEVVKTGKFAVVTDLDVAKDRENLVVHAFGKLADPGEYEFRISSTIPLSGGLGSSAAAVVAGLMAARRLTGTEEESVIRDASDIEGHADNVVASVLGGFAISLADREPIRIDVPAGLGAVLVVPHEAVRTTEARAVLPAQVPLADAAANLATASALAIGLERGDLELISKSLGDRLHQTPRAPLFPRCADLLGRAKEFGALGATISGAGPTVLFWCKTDAAAEAEARLARETTGWAKVRRTDFEPAGAAFR